MARKKKQMNVQSDSMFEIFSVSKKDAVNGIGPKDKINYVENQTLELIGEETTKIDEANETKKKYNKNGQIKWDKVKSSPDARARSKHISDWDSKNFYFYFSDQYKLKYKEDLPFIREVCIPIMKKVKEKFEKITSKKIDPQIIVDYIDWFILNEIDKIISKIQFFNIHSVYYESIIKRFLSQYKSVNYVLEYPFQEACSPISFENMELIFKSSRINFIMKYGFVITFNWLISFKKLSPSDAKDMILVIIKDAMKEGDSSISKAISATNQLSPYPDSYKHVYLNPVLDSFVGKINIKYEPSVIAKF